MNKQNELVENQQQTTLILYHLSQLDKEIKNIIKDINEANNIDTRKHWRVWTKYLSGLVEDLQKNVNIHNKLLEKLNLKETVEKLLLE